jgi:hypothetical protein
VQEHHAFLLEKGRLALGEVIRHLPRREDHSMPGDRIPAASQYLTDEAS